MHPGPLYTKTSQTFCFGVLTEAAVLPSFLATAPRSDMMPFQRSLLRYTLMGAGPCQSGSRKQPPRWGQPGQNFPSEPGVKTIAVPSPDWECSQVLIHHQEHAGVL